MTANRRRTLRIGLTGPIGCGKSTVAGWLAARGAVVVDADALTRDVMVPGEPAFDAIVARFGAAVVAGDGSLDRAALGRLAFADAAALRDLEAIVHPAVRPRILDAIGAAEDSGAPAVIVEAIKLVEGGLASLCDEVWLVTCRAGEQRARLRGRGMDQAEVGRRVAIQAGLWARVQRSADRVLDTSGPPAATLARALAAYESALSTSRGS